MSFKAKAWPEGDLNKWSKASLVHLHIEGAGAGQVKTRKCYTREWRRAHTSVAQAPNSRAWALAPNTEHSSSNPYPCTKTGYYCNRRITPWALRHTFKPNHVFIMLPCSRQQARVAHPTRHQMLCMHLKGTPGIASICLLLTLPCCWQTDYVALQMHFC